MIQDRDNLSLPMLENKADNRTDGQCGVNLLTMLEPIMIVFLGGVIGGIVISMYLPIFTLIRHLSG